MCDTVTEIINFFMKKYTFNMFHWLEKIKASILKEIKMGHFCILDDLVTNISNQKFNLIY